MKPLPILLALLLCAVVGCAGNPAAESWAEHTWEYREAYILANDHLTDLQKEQALYHNAAAIGVPPDEVDALVDAELGLDSETERQDE